jgi:Flp pilus assembly protein TadG
LRDRPGGTEVGAATTELVVATPALLLLVMMVIQMGLWFHASHVVTAAAQEGARQVRIEGGSAAAGEGRAREFLTAMGAKIVVAPTVIASRSADSGRVEVAGTAISVVPGMNLPVRAVSEGPVENFRGAR